MVCLSRPRRRVAYAPGLGTTGPGRSLLASSAAGADRLDEERRNPDADEEAETFDFSLEVRRR